MHRARAGGLARGPRAAADGFVILQRIVAPDEVVHGALRCGNGLQRAEQCVDQVLRSFDIAGDDRGRVLRVNHRVVGDDDAHRFQTAFVERNVVVDQASKHIQHRGAHHRRRRVEVAGMLLGGAGEIDHRLLAFLVHANRDLNARAVVHLVRELPVAQHPQHPPHRLLGVVLHMPHVSMHGVDAVVRGQRVQLARAFLARRQLRFEVGDVHARIARRPLAAGQQFMNFLLAESVVLHQLEVVDDHAFFFDGGGIGRRRARGFAADVGVVAARCDIKQQLPGVGEHRFDDGDIRQVRAAVVGRV